MSALTAALKGKGCMHPEAPLACKGGTIRAHSIQRRGGLDLIARSGKVYKMSADIGDLLRNRTELGVRLVGIKQASTFSGFCAYHDSTTFEQIDTGRISLSETTAFLTGYRALCRHLHVHRACIAAHSEMRDVDRGLPPLAQILLQTLHKDIGGPGLRALRGLEALKAHADRMLISSEFGGVRYYGLEFEAKPEFLSTVVLPPNEGFRGEKIRNLDNPDHAQLLTCSVVATADRTLALFSWHGEQEACTAFVRSLHAMPDSELSDCLVRLVFGYCENSYMNPGWWDGLGRSGRDTLLARWQWVPPSLQDAPSLAPDGVRYWEGGAVQRTTNLLL